MWQKRRQFEILFKFCTNILLELKIVLYLKCYLFSALSYTLGCNARKNVYLLKVSMTLKIAGLTHYEVRVNRTSDPEMGEEHESIISIGICQPSALELS